MAGKKSDSKPSTLSAEFVQDSSDDESERDASKSPVKSSQVPNGIANNLKSINKSLPANAVSRESSSSDSTNSNSDESNNSDASDDDETSSVASSQSSKKRTRDLNDGRANHIVKKPRSSGPPARIAAKPFEPPTGYEPLNNEVSDYATNSSQMFDDLTNKQVWHIVAPASFPIDSIKELDVQAVLKGDTVFKKDGTNYNMNALSVRNEILLLPQGHDLHYSQNKTGVARSFQLREVTKQKADPTDATKGVVTEGQNFAASEPGVKPKPRSQPEGLKMRYTPFGAGITVSKPQTNGDVEMQDTFQVPEQIGEDPTPKGSKKKHKHRKDKASLADDIPGSVTEKDRLETSQTTRQKSPEQETSREGKDKKKKKKRSKLIDQPVL